MALGVNIDADISLIEKSIIEANIGFMMAPRHHSAPAMSPAQKWSLLSVPCLICWGPSNPAMVNSLMVGVFSADWVEPLARVLGEQGLKRLGLSVPAGLMNSRLMAPLSFFIDKRSEYF